MAGELEQVVRDFIAAIDARDVDRMLAVTAEDAQGVDELSRNWQRGKSEVEAYVRRMMGAVSDLQTELRDVQENVWGDAGIVTGWIEQRYTYEGEAQQISAPTSIALHREDGAWKLALFHSVPLPEQTS